MQGETAPLQNMMELMEAKMGGREKRNFIYMFAITAPLLLREAGTDQVRQILWACTAVHRYVTRDVCLCEWFFRPFWEEKF